MATEDIRSLARAYAEGTIGRQEYRERRTRLLDDIINGVVELPPEQLPVDPPPPQPAPPREPTAPTLPAEPGKSATPMIAIGLLAAVAIAAGAWFFIAGDTQQATEKTSASTPASQPGQRASALINQFIDETDWSEASQDAFIDQWANLSDQEQYAAGTALRKLADATYQQIIALREAAELGSDDETAALLDFASFLGLESPSLLALLKENDAAMYEAQQKIAAQEAQARAEAAAAAKQEAEARARALQAEKEAAELAARAKAEAQRAEQQAAELAAQQKAEALLAVQRAEQQAAAEKAAALKAAKSEAERLQAEKAAEQAAIEARARAEAAAQQAAAEAEKKRIEASKAAELAAAQIAQKKAEADAAAQQAAKLAAKKKADALRASQSASSKKSRAGGCRVEQAKTRRPYCRDTLPDNRRGPKLVVLTPGEFQMGSTRRPEEGPVHTVKIDYPIAVSVNEVSSLEYQIFCQATQRQCPPPAWGESDYPVVNVSWDDAVAYTEWLSKVTGKTYRLPTEAEWEYVARAGTTTPYPFGDEILPTDARYSLKGKLDSPLPRSNRSINKNGFRLYHMVGNVREWTADSWAPDYNGAPTDGSARVGTSPLRVVRGGTYADGGLALRSAARDKLDPATKDRLTGFRIVQDLRKQ